jgi:pilus assembly protein CpaF
MALRERAERLRQKVDASVVPAVVDRPPAPSAPEAPPRVTASPTRVAYLTEVRSHLQVEVVRAFQSLIDVPDAEVTERIAGIVDRIISENDYSMTRDERLGLIKQLVDDITGLGPLEPLLRDTAVTEVMVNGAKNVYVERRGKIEKVAVSFINDEHVERIIDRIISPIGRHIDETSPRVDARLPDGSRVNAIIPPLSLIGPVITIRRFAAKPYTVEDLVGFGTATQEMFDFIKCCVLARLNIFVSGGTGSGKTTLLNVLSSFIPEDERIITIEDAAELQLNQEHVVTLESRPPNIEGEGAITIRDLLRNSLHMRPDRLIVGECRGGEALDMIQAMTTGQEGSLSTGHANTAADMLRRLETMILMTGYEMPLRAIREQIVSAVDLIVHTARLKDGSRKIVSIVEVYGIEDDEILTQEIFTYVQTGVVDGKVEGYLKPTGIRPTFMGQFKAHGVRLPADEFGIPSEADAPPLPAHAGKGRWDAARRANAEQTRLTVGLGKVVAAGGMVYVSGVGPIDPETGQVVLGGMKEQTRQCMANLKAKLEGAGTSLERIALVNWSLKDQGDFDEFNEEFVRWMAGDPPVGQETMMPRAQRRAGFRISLGAIAEG